jgi:hypothetical protein
MYLVHASSLFPYVDVTHAEYSRCLRDRTLALSVAQSMRESRMFGRTRRCSQIEVNVDDALIADILAEQVPEAEAEREFLADTTRDTFPPELLYHPDVLAGPATLFHAIRGVLLLLSR